MTWVTLHNPDTGGTADFPDEVSVLAAAAARGWVAPAPAEDPEPPFEPRPGGDDGPEKFVAWRHPDTGHIAEFPNNEGATDAAVASGWKPYSAPPAEGSEHPGAYLVAGTIAEALEAVGDDLGLAALALAAELADRNRVGLISALEALLAD